jgi:predicted transposase YdaD
MGIEKYDELARKVGEARGHYEEFVQGKKIAATRARKALQEIKKLAQDARIEIQGIKKAPEAPSP